jgi:hypothetical protein
MQWKTIYRCPAKGNTGKQTKRDNMRKILLVLSIAVLICMTACTTQVTPRPTPGVEQTLTPNASRATPEREGPGAISGRSQCADTDGGDDMYVKGFVDVEGYGWDACSDNSTLTEQNCVVDAAGAVLDTAVSTSHYCPNGCTDGTCVRDGGVQGSQDSIPETQRCSRCSNQYKYAWADFDGDANCNPIDLYTIKYSVNCGCRAGSETYSDYDRLCANAVVYSRCSNKYQYAWASFYSADGGATPVSADAVNYSVNCACTNGTEILAKLSPITCAGGMQICSRCSYVYQYAWANFSAKDCATANETSDTKYTMNCICAGGSKSLFNFSETCSPVWSAYKNNPSMAILSPNVSRLLEPGQKLTITWRNSLYAGSHGGYTQINLHKCLGEVCNRQLVDYDPSSDYGGSVDNNLVFYPFDNIWADLGRYPTVYANRSGISGSVQVTIPENLFPGIYQLVLSEAIESGGAGYGMGSASEKVELVLVRNTSHTFKTSLQWANTGYPKINEVRLGDTVGLSLRQGDDYQNGGTICYFGPDYPIKECVWKVSRIGDKVLPTGSYDLAMYEGNLSEPITIVDRCSRCSDRYRYTWESYFGNENCVPFDQGGVERTLSCGCTTGSESYSDYGSKCTS